VEATRRIRQVCPQTEVVALSLLGEEEAARAMLDTGASCFLRKDGPAEELYARIRQVRRGG
jgi:DNA-binding NarL/FixJ family response regulator